VPVEVFGADEQEGHDVDLEAMVALASAVLEAEGIREPAEVALLFVDEATIAEHNLRFMKKQGPTDVLSFPIEDEFIPSGRFPDSGTPGPGMNDEADEEPPLLLGDVLICPSVAERNAAEHGLELDDVISLLVVHGLLHLLGWDHQIDAEAERMEARERQLLARLRPPGTAS
jgi:probable rRNA maturation factor